MRFVATFVALVFSFAHARDYYVAPTGNDSNAGTQSAPWVSINKGVDLYVPGDTIYLRAGTYTPSNSIYFYRAGSSTAPITFRAFPGESVILDGANMPASTTLVYIAAQYFVMQDFELRNATLNGITIESTSFVTVRNCKVHDSKNSGIFVGKGDMTSTHDITIDSCTVYNNVHMNDAHALSGGWSGALVAGGAVNVTFTNNTSYKNQGEGIIFYLADKCSAVGNTSHDNFGVNLYLDNATNTTVSGNLIYNSGDATYYVDGTVPATGIQYANEVYNISNPSANNTIINNIFTQNNYAFVYGNYGNGGGLKNFTFANNSMYLSNRELIHVDPDAHSNAVFCNNICFQSSLGTQVVLPTSLAGLSFSHNVWNGAAAGAASGSGDVNANPLFVNPGTFNAADYKLQANSPAAAMGMTVTAVTTDFFGTARTQPLDCGAAVAPAASTTPPPTTPPPTTPPPTTPPPSNTAPTFTSPPSASPNPAVAGQPIVLSAAATDADGDALTYTWILGDGSTFSGPTLSKTYANPGTYTIAVTVSDGQLNATASVIVTVTAPAAPPVTGTFAVSSFSASFNLTYAGRDTLSVAGTVQVPGAFNPTGASAVIAIGGFQHAVTLTSSGTSTDRTFKLRGHMARGAFTTTTVNFVLSIKRATLYSQFQSLGLSPYTGLYRQTVPLSLTVASGSFTDNAPLTYAIAGGK
ncbi:MAG TPA: PKD domain-containing protein [Planctomycetota bacterium]|nr:PKD domain-containing protein [Planctomycetota bacterium]